MRKARHVMEQLTTGHLAQLGAVNLETIRYYERRGLIPKPGRTAAGYRQFPPDAVRRLRFIKRAQELGFSLDEVRNLLTLEDGQSCRATWAMAKTKLASVQARVADLRRMERLLKGLIAECESGKRPQACPIIRALSREQ